MPEFHCPCGAPLIRRGKNPPKRCQSCGKAHLKERSRQIKSGELEFIPFKDRPGYKTVAERNLEIRERRAASQGVGCRACGKPISGGRSKFCSAKCSAYIQGQKRRPPIQTRACVECGKEFTTPQSDKRYCGRRCRERVRDRIYVTRRRVRVKAGENVKPLKVFERDGWHCKECGRETPRALMGSTDPLAPEMDHIVGIADDGEHTYANVQLLCRGCNLVKGQRDQARRRAAQFECVELPISQK